MSKYIIYTAFRQAATSWLIVHTFHVRLQLRDKYKTDRITDKNEEKHEAPSENYPINVSV